MGYKIGISTHSMENVFEHKRAAVKYKHTNVDNLVVIPHVYKQ